MNPQWHYIQNGQEHGPVTWDALVQLGALGLLLPGDLVWHEGMAAWMPAAEVPGLLQTNGDVEEASDAPPAHPQNLDYFAPHRPIRIATIGARFGAFLLDYVVLYAGKFAIDLAATAGFALIRRRTHSVGPMAASIIDNDIIQAFLFLIMIWLYNAIMESSRIQATVGKRFVGVYVTDLAGQRITFGRATIRFIGKCISWIFFIGFIIAAFTKRKQALHDLMAETLVVEGTLTRGSFGSLPGRFP